MDKREETKSMIKNNRLWPGETLCLKRKPRPGKPWGDGYGVLTNGSVPLIVYLQPDFSARHRYESIDALLDDGWTID